MGIYDRLQSLGTYLRAIVYNIPDSGGPVLTPELSRGAASDSLLSIFLSSTFEDLKDYRKEIKQALDKAQVACFLIEEAASGYVDTVKKCREELEKATGYVGIFAYWYGSVPPKSKRSITHMEFQWAREKYKKKPDPPLLVLMPAPLSDAEKKLKAKASKLIPNKYKGPEHDKLLRAFHSEVTAWRIYKPFRNQQEAIQLALICCVRWQGHTAMSVAGSDDDPEKRGRLPRAFSDEELGSIGRKEQLDVAESILSQVGLRPDVPAVGMLVHGNEAAGQRAFLRRLLTTKALTGGRPAQVTKPPFEHYELLTLTQWVGKSLGLTSEAEAPTPEELAERAYEQLHHQQLCFVLDDIHRLAGGVAAFQSTLWLPLYKRLKELHARNPASHRLIAVVADYTDQARSWADIVEKYNFNPEKTNYSRLLMLPRLRPFTQADLLSWFGEVGVPDNPLGWRAERARIILTNPAGKVDGTPRRVFEMLGCETLWPEGEAQ
jgi:hypothetical protein